MNDRSLYCTFHLGDYYFGIEVTSVQEVLLDQCWTPVPLAPPERASRNRRPSE